MNAVGWALVGLAGGFLALALYGKYRILKDEYREAVEEETRRRQDQPREEPPISG